MTLTGTLAMGVRGAIIYALGAALQRGLPVLLLPVYASALTPPEYGQIALLVSISAVVGSLLGLGLEAAVTREVVLLATDQRERYCFINSVGLLALLAPIAGGTAGWVLLAGLTSSAGLPESLVLLALLATSLQVPYTVFVAAILRAEERHLAYAATATVNAVANAGATVLLVTHWHLGPTGWFLGSLIAAVGSLAVGVPALGHRWSLAIDMRHVRTALLLGLPLLPHTLSHWGLNLSDRIILSAYWPAAEVGVYNVAYQIAAVIGVLIVAVNQAALPLYARAIDTPAWRDVLSRVVTSQTLLAAWLGATVALLAPSLIRLVFPAEYWGAAAIVPWVALGYVFLGLYLTPTNALTVMLGRTRWVWLPTVVAAAANIVLNLALVPSMGAAAAAVSTAIGYAVLLVGMSLLRRLTAGPSIALDWRAMAMGVGAVLTGWALGIVAVTDDDPRALLVRAVICLVVASVSVLIVRERATTHQPTTSGADGVVRASNG